MFDITRAISGDKWLEDVTLRLREKMPASVEKARRVSFMPYSTSNGAWQPTDIDWWTNGFWPASMWQMYLMTGEKLYREEAIRAESMLDEALRNFKKLHHDVAFMWLIHSGVRFALEGNMDSFDRTLLAANLLAGRFNPVGFIRAWNGSENVGRAIIDCMMNLSLLYWGTRHTGDPRYKNIAMRHADTTIKYFLRPDGSCNHIVDFDPETGEYTDNPAGQGCFSGSSWSRGQAWALYGFTLSFLNTGKDEYLDAARRVADYFISQIADDFIPRCDFRQPPQPALKDNAAGNIAASGLLELARALDENEGRRYFDAAISILKAQEADSADWSKDEPAIFTKCSTAWRPDTRHITMTYADFFFIEAINKLRSEKLLAWTC